MIMGTNTSSLAYVAPYVHDSLVYSHAEAVLADEEDAMALLCSYASCEKVLSVAIQQPTAVNLLGAVQSGSQAVLVMQALFDFSHGMSSALASMLRHLCVTIDAQPASNGASGQRGSANPLDNWNSLAHLAILKQIAQLLSCINALDQAQLDGRTSIATDLSLFRRVRHSVIAQKPDESVQIHSQVRSALDRSRALAPDPTINYQRPPQPSELLSITRKNPLGNSQTLNVSNDSHHANTGSSKKAFLLLLRTQTIEFLSNGNHDTSHDDSSKRYNSLKRLWRRDQNSGRGRALTLAEFEVPMRLTAICTAPDTLVSICPRARPRRMSNPTVDGMARNSSNAREKPKGLMQRCRNATRKMSVAPFFKVSSPSCSQGVLSNASAAPPMLDENTAREELNRVMVNDPVAHITFSKLAFFWAHATPFTSNVVRTLTTLAASDNRIEALLSKIANLLLQHTQVNVTTMDEECLLLCCRAVTCAVVLVDRISSRGVFHSSSSVEVGDAITLLKKLPKMKPDLSSHAQKECNRLLDAVRFWTIHLGDRGTSMKFCRRLHVTPKERRRR